MMNVDKFKKRVVKFYKLYSFYHRCGIGTTGDSLAVPFLTLLGYDCCSSDVLDYNMHSNIHWISVGKSDLHKARIKFIFAGAGVALPDIEKAANLKLSLDADFCILTDGVIFHAFAYSEMGQPILFKSFSAADSEKLCDAAGFLMPLLRGAYDMQSAMNKMDPLYR